MRIMDRINRKRYERNEKGDMDKLLREAEISLNLEKRKKALLNIQEVIDAKNIMLRPSKWKLLGILLQNITPTYWIGQSMVLTAAFFFLHQMKLLQVEKSEYLLWFSVGAALIGIIGISELARHVSYHMMELEQSCYFNLKQMWTIHMILFGSVDILALSCFSGIISRRIEREFLAVCVYLFVPFVLSNLCYLLLFTAARCGGHRYWQFGTAAAMGILSIVPSLMPRAYYLSYLWVWILILAAAITLLIRECFNIRKKFTEGEILCWN